MANEENLKSFDSLTVSQQREIAQKGGKASVKAKRERKAMKEQMELLLSLPIKDERTRKKFEDLGIDSDELTNQMALIVATYQKALKGDTSAINIVREMIGERVQEVKINTIKDESVLELQRLLNEETTNKSD